MIFDTPAAIKGLKTSFYGQWKNTVVPGPLEILKTCHQIFENPGIVILKKSRNPGIPQGPGDGGDRGDGGDGVERGDCLQVLAWNGTGLVWGSNACNIYWKEWRFGQVSP